MITCPQCKREIGDLANFCDQCGSKLPPPSVPINPEEKQNWLKTFGDCKNRKKLLPRGEVDDAKFCPGCGKKLTPGQKGLC